MAERIPARPEPTVDFREMWSEYRAAVGKIKGAELAHCRRDAALILSAACSSFHPISAARCS
ncbi:hypothetical protein MPL3356_350099 [Mesorhizobium plurifarium]|uniref:Uncharacterized protein n=1 Tax=Mesorhizobium plurifarium TaxID=69974 RepID=A0A090EQW9_MESPL|nr:hypothetical protein MPL3356_350099 [Mesorhizobium plurifarium]CDX31274.1 hypothetical protein MPLDJ20_140225 [Mesorhizobium plurifarium]